MGSPKALLRDSRGRTFIARLLRSFGDAGFREATVVTGRLHAALVAAVASDAPPLTVTFARNADPSRGQLSSLWVALDHAARPGVEAILVTLVDVPFVSPATIGRVVATWRQTHAPIVRPASGERHGHPVLFDRSVFAELRAAPPGEGAKAVVHAHASRVVNVAIEDEGAFVDIDTPEDYKAIGIPQP